jgi:hypothetical protein
MSFYPDAYLRLARHAHTLAGPSMAVESRLK